MLLCYIISQRFFTQSEVAFRRRVMFGLGTSMATGKFKPTSSDRIMKTVVLMVPLKDWFTEKENAQNNIN